MTKRSRRTRHLKLRRAVIATCLKMNALGINQGTSGNVSARVPEGFLITPSGVAYEETAPEQIVAVDLEGHYDGPWKPSSEWRMHRDIYASRPEAQAVVHTHSIHATALSTLRQDIPAFHYMIAVAGGASLRCAAYATFGSEALSRNMLKALRNRSACLLANHGMICFGPNLEKALWLAGEIEALCEQYAVARQLGDPVLLSQAEMKRVLALFQDYGKQGESAAETEPAPRRKPTARTKTAGRGRSARVPK